MSITRKRRHEAMLEQGMHAGNTDAKFDPPPDPRVINVRVTSIEKRRLTEIAGIAGLSLSAFLRMAAIKEAHKILGPPKLVSASSLPADRLVSPRTLGCGEPEKTGGGE